MIKPLIIETEWVRPVDDGNIPCITCASGGARWAVGKPPNGYFSCARCFLYSSPWGKNNSEKIRELVTAVEKSMGRKISDNGVLLSTEADRILSSIIQISGVKKIRSRKKTST